VRTRHIKAADLLPSDDIIERNNKGEVVKVIHVSEIERGHCSSNGIHVNAHWCFEPWADVEVQI
jgi:hypothetical protein